MQWGKQVFIFILFFCERQASIVVNNWDRVMRILMRYLPIHIWLIAASSHCLPDFSGDKRGSYTFSSCPNYQSSGCLLLAARLMSMIWDNGRPTNNQSIKQLVPFCFFNFIFCRLFKREKEVVFTKNSLLIKKCNTIQIGKKMYWKLFYFFSR